MPSHLMARSLVDIKCSEIIGEYKYAMIVYTNEHLHLGVEAHVCNPSTWLRCRHEGQEFKNSRSTWDE